MRQNSSDRRVGRPSKGERMMFGVRAPMELAQVVVAEAEARELPQTEYISRIVARFHGSTVEIPPRTQQLDIPDLRQRTRRFSTRRSTGPGQHYFGLLLPMDQAERTIAEAKARGLARSKYVALILAEHHGFEGAVPDRQHPIPEQTQMALGA